MKVKSLEEFGEKKFMAKLFELMNNPTVYNTRNQQWFEHLITNWDDKDKYKKWFFLVDGEELVAFATIQEYYSGCYRMLTRLYITRKYRSFTQTREDKWMSPSMRILRKQLDYLDERYRTIFVSMQDVRRRSAAERYLHKLEWLTADRWTLHPDMMQTCNNARNKECWQNIIYNGESPHLNYMSTGTWKKLH